MEKKPKLIIGIESAKKLKLDNINLFADIKPYPIKALGMEVWIDSKLKNGEAYLAYL